MIGYFGTDEHQRLQRKSDQMMPWIMTTPGACVTGRLMASDDWHALGWDVIRTHLAEDGSFAFRWASPAQVEDIKHALSDTGANVFGWSGFMGDAADILPRTKTKLAQPLPNGLTSQRARAQQLAALQPFLTVQGIVPLSTALMGGDLCPALSQVICKQNGTIVAGGFVGMLQNQHSHLADCAWMGLIASEPTMRNQGLASRIVAELLHAAIDELGARRVIAFAAPDNTASIAMLTAIGMMPRSEGSYVATLSVDRPTR